MANLYFIEDTTLENMAKAIRSKSIASDNLTPEQMTTAINNITNRDSSSLSVSGATVTVPAGFYASQASKSIATGSATTPDTTISVEPSISIDSAGKITASASGSKSVTPNVSAGYVSTGTAGTISVSGSNTEQLTTKGTTTIIPNTSDQTAVEKNVYTTGVITVKGDAELVAANIKKGVEIFGVTGTYDSVPNLLDKTLTANGTYTAGSGYDGFGTITVDVEGSLDLQAKEVDPSTSKQVVNADTGYDGLSQVTVNAIPVTELATPSITVSADGSITASTEQTAGYVESGTKSSTYQLTANDDTDFTAENIKNGVTIFGVTGTFTSDADATAEQILNGKTAYVDGEKVTGTMPTGSYDAAGGELSPGAGTVSAHSTNITLNEVYSEPASGYYITAQGSGSVNRAAITKSATGGVVSTGTSTVSDATSTSSETATRFYSVPTGSCTVSGGDLSGGDEINPSVSLADGSDTNMSNITIGAKSTSTYPYYFKVSGSSSSGSSTVSRAAVTDTHTAGYIPAKSATNVIDPASKTVTVNAGSGSSYVGLKEASLSASGSATASATVEPGDLSLITQVIPVSGKTLVPVDATTSSSEISTPFFAVVRPQVEAGSGSISGSGTASASVSSAGYAPTSLTGSVDISVSGTATSNAKYGDSYYLSIPEGEVTAAGGPYTVTPHMSYKNGVITADVTDMFIKTTPEVTKSGYVTSNQAKEKITWLDGSNTITDSNLIAENIKNGVSIFGVTGIYGSVGGNGIKYGEKLTQESSDYAGGQVTYRFKQIEDGYWESTNKGVDSSYSLSRFSFEVFETCDVTFEVINYAESNYDYAIFSSLDSYFSASASADVSNVYKSYKGSSSASIQELTYYNVSHGTHVISVKFIKDTSSSNNNDSVRFRLKSPVSSDILPRLAAGDRDLLASNIKAGVEIYGVTGTGGDVITLRQGDSATVHIADAYSLQSGGFSYMVENVNVNGISVVNSSTDLNLGYFTISTSSSSNIGETGLIIRYYKNPVETAFAHYRLNITS